MPTPAPYLAAAIQFEPVLGDIEGNTEALLRLCGAQGLTVLLLAEALIGLTETHAHAKLLLSEIAKLSGGRQLGGAVRLLGAKAELLLLLGRLQGLLIATTEKV